jgi:hypothetical protein
LLSDLVDFLGFGSQFSRRCFIAFICKELSAVLLDLLKIDAAVCAGADVRVSAAVSAGVRAVIGFESARGTCVGLLLFKLSNRLSRRLGTSIPGDELVNRFDCLIRSWGVRTRISAGVCVSPVVGLNNSVVSATCVSAGVSAGVCVSPVVGFYSATAIATA